MRNIVSRQVFVLLTTCLAFAFAFAQEQSPPSPPPLTEEDAVALAIRQNPRLTAALREVSAGKSGVRSARALTNPSVVFTPGITSRGGSDEEFLIVQPLELNGVRAARTGAAGARLKQSQAEAVIVMRDLIYETKVACYELSRARGLLSLAQEALKTAEEFDRIAARQVEVGNRAGIDQVQTGIEVARARQQVILARSRVTAAEAALNTLMGRTPAEPIGALPSLTFTPTELDADVARRQALTARTEITAEQAVQEAIRQEARLARREGSPDLAPQFRMEKVLRGAENSGIGLGITLPLFDYGSRRHRARQAETAAKAQEARIAATQNQVRQEVEQALARVRAAEEIIKGYQQGILDQARRLLEASRVGLQAGVTTVVAVLEAQRTYRGVLTEYTNALADQAQARAELERATGTVSAEMRDDGMK